MTMRKTLLLVFIHGFKGTDETFEKFPEHLRTLISDALPNLNIAIAIYPRYDTRGDLRETVAKLRDWLQNKVIDLEVAANAPSPTVDPSVRTILIGHSMGGIVAAETLISIAGDQPIPSARMTPADQEQPRNNTTEQADTSSDPSTTTPHLGVPDPTQSPSSAPPPSSDKYEAPQDEQDHDGALLFPYIQGILAFDTPYLGIHPGVVAHGAEAHYNTASAAMSAYTSATKLFGGNSSTAAAAVDASKALPASTSQASGGWGRYALYAGGAAALAAVGGAAYANRNQISSGWNWVGSHLVFVGCLARGAEMAQRVESVVKLGDRYGIGFADFYTKLGRQGETKVAGQLVGEERTFCVVPKEAKQDRGEGGRSPAKKQKMEPGAKSMKGHWVEAINTTSKDEVTAHRAMFTPGDHPGYYQMSDKARNLVVSWVDRGWYSTSQ